MLNDDLVIGILFLILGNIRVWGRNKEIFIYLI